MIEWLASSSYSFLEGVAAPEEMILNAKLLGYEGVGLGDRMGLYGLVRAFKASHDIDSQRFFAPGIRLHFDIADPLYVYPLHRKAYGDLCRYLSQWALDGMSLHEKGLSPLSWPSFRDFLKKRVSLAQDYVLISVSGRFFPWVSDSNDETRLQTQDAKAPTPTFCNPPTAPGQCPFWLLELADLSGRGHASALSLAYPINFSPGLEDLQQWLEEQSRLLRIPLLATTLPLYALKEDQDLCDLMTAIRHKKKITDLGYLRQANGDRRLLARHERDFLREQILKRDLFNDPFARSLELSTRHHFALSELKYKYPTESVPQGFSATSWLKHLVFEGARDRYPNGIPEAAQKQIEHELSLIRELGYEDYFLTIWDILRYARSQNILLQGRGSAANSAVCYCLGITAIDPVQMNLLFERFMSLERREPPDIDVDFEHERREEVIQEVYRRYGRERAAMVATVICFRGRMAIRETAKALGFTLESIDRLSEFMGREGMRRLSEDDPTGTLKATLKEHGISPHMWKRLLTMAPRVVGLPRHLSIHTGGFVLSNERLDEMCILEPARMENRSVVPWDKDDVDALKWMKVDLLSLGILTAIRKSFQYCAQTRLEAPFDRNSFTDVLAAIPQDCEKVYASLRRADTVGVFQVESRAQMSMLPRLAPRKFYDLVIEIAIVRPGPLQGGMVHPYLERRRNPKSVRYDHEKLKPILEKTLGVPIFQEQVMKIAVEVGGFSPGEADQLRKVMSGAWRARSHMSVIRKRLFDGMAKHGLSGEFAERIYKQIEGFGEYGFPESHSASFSILAYASAWLKVHRPSEFLCAMLNSQPMGFYSPALLISDAERHGVVVLPVDILGSRWDNSLEANPFNAQKPFVRLGLRQIRGFSENEARLIEQLQDQGILSFEHENLPTIEKLYDHGLEPKTLEKLVQANALRGLSTQQSAPDPRRYQHWELLALRSHDPSRPTLKLEQLPDARDFLNSFDEWESLLADGMTIGCRTRVDSINAQSAQHVAQYAREKFFPETKWVRAEDIYALPENRKCFVIGFLCIKQRPPTAKGLAFMTLEDETGFLNLVLMPDIYERYRLIADSGRILAAEAILQRSALSDPQDPRSCSVTLKVTRLWNPFLEQGARQAHLATKEIRFEARNYH